MSENKYSNLSLETIINIISDDEILNSDLCYNLIKRSIDEKNQKFIKLFFQKISSILVFESSTYRKKIVQLIHPLFENYLLENISLLLKDSIFGNIIVIYHFIKKYRSINSTNFNEIDNLSKLKFINDPNLFDFIPVDDKLLLNIDEEIKAKSIQSMKKSIKLYEWFFFNNLIDKSKSTMVSFQLLYEISNETDLKYKSEVIKALIDNNIKLFNHLMDTIFKVEIKDENDIINNYHELYEKLLRRRIPIYFNYFNLRYNGYLFNDNCYFLIYQNKSGDKRILNPYKQIDLNNVVKIYEIKSKQYITPRERYGKMQIQDIYSFQKYKEIKSNPSEKKLEIVKKLSEDEIEIKINEIIFDPNKTPHGPVEKADIFTSKLYINNKDDLRNSAFIIKGKGTPTIRIGNIATNIIKAMDISSDIVFLVYTGNILDEPKEHFIKQCNTFSKMYCIINLIELTKLFIAYKKI